MGSMETSPSAIAFRGIRNVDMIPFIRDVIDTLREFDLRRVGSSMVYKTRMETELQPHLVPHWVQPLQQPPHTPFFHTRIQKWKRHNMMRVLEAAADEIAGIDAKIAEVSDALRRRVEPMGPHLQVAVDSFIQRLRLNRSVLGAVPSGPLLQLGQDNTRVKVEIGAAAVGSSITTENIRVRGNGAKRKGVLGSQSMEDCLSSNSSLGGKRALSKDDTPKGSKAKRLCVWDLSSSKSAAVAAASVSSGSVEKAPLQGDKLKAGFRFEIPAVDTESILAFLKSGLKAIPPKTPPPSPSPRNTSLASLTRSSDSFATPPKQIDLKQEYDLLGSLDFMLGPISEDQGLPWQDDDVSESHLGAANQVVHEFDISNGVSERLSERDPSPEDLDFDEYQEAVFAAASTQAGEHFERELVEDARALLQSTLGMGQCSHVGALRLALVAEKLLPVIEQLQERSLGLDALAPEEAQALDMLSALLMGARERVQHAMEDDSEDIMVEMDTAKAIEQEASQLEKIADTFLSVVGTEILQEQRVQLRLAAAHNRLAAALSHQGWVEEAQSQMSQANSILSKLRGLVPKQRALSPPPECPISMEKMEDPVVLTTGHTFERSAIQRWLNAGNTTCPITRQQLTDLELVPNKALRGYSARWHAENGLKQPQASVWPEVTMSTAAVTTTESEKCKEVLPVDDFLEDVLKGAVGSRGSGFDLFGLGEVVNGKCGGACTGDGGLSSNPADSDLWNLDMMHWAVST